MFHQSKPAPGGASYPLLGDRFVGPWSSIEPIPSATRSSEDDDFEGTRNWSVILVFASVLVPAFAVLAAIIL
ncbi:hypothetical protein HGO38_01905 [Rhizobium sp. CG5]|uniref:hypothetical protein n=1 Tax=Rhizobium sp. CG5 TaxID=2726076 RepID=UPI002033B83E|nr:hypothetical protein [Rhizobium sp. CG5]MCM2472230.1 hypothetical protein [Rhizobium sp. CG5]